MPNYRRLYIPGGTYFFTVNLAKRSSDLLVAEIDLVRQAYRLVQEEMPFHTLAISILPDHLHCVWKLPQGDSDFSTRWKRIKREVSVRLPKERDAHIPRRKGERGIWQRRFWEHAIRSDEDLERSVDYVHFNAVKHGYVSSPEDWPYSSYKTMDEKYQRRPTSDGGFHPPYEWE